MLFKKLRGQIDSLESENRKLKKEICGLKRELDNTLKFKDCVVALSKFENAIHDDLCDNEAIAIYSTCDFLEIRGIGVDIYDKDNEHLGYCGLIEDADTLKIIDGKITLAIEQVRAMLKSNKSED